MDPTKTVLGVTGGGGLVATVGYFANRFGAHITNDDIAHAGAALAVVGALVAHYGIRGLAKAVWRGVLNGTTAGK